MGEEELGLGEKGDQTDFLRKIKIFKYQLDNNISQKRGGSRVFQI